jgi:hypothetical protein
VTLSLKGAKSPTRGRKLRSTGTKARAHVSSGPNSLIELKKQLEARTHELSEAREQQAATSEVLQVISNSPGELQPVFQAILANATRLCEAKFGTLFLCEGDAFRVASLHNAPMAYAEARTGNADRPSAAPMVLTFAAVQARHNRNVAVTTWVFVAAYILVWAHAGLVVYVLLHAGKDLVYHLGWFQNGAWARLALGVTLTLAGLYQFTPLKRLCLHRCRSPLAFLKQHWRDGCEDASEMGLWHGLYCLGCCWALFGVMLAAAGMMRIAWMLLLTLVVFAEKALPYGSRISVALGLIALGLLVGTGAVQLGG